MADPNEELTVNYVPGEVCIVVEPGDIGDEEKFYRAVQDRMNRWINSNLNTPIPHSSDPSFDNDSTPDVMQRKFDRHSPVLTDLERSPSGIVPPLIVLPAVERDGASPLSPTNGRPRTTLLFYQIGDAGKPVPPGDLGALHESRELVRELVVWANRRIVEENAILCDGDAVGSRIVAVCPNWLHIAAPQSCGGPGGVPEQVANDDVPNAGARLIRFVNQDLSKHPDLNVPPTDPGESNRVAVAVLDTCPDADRLAAINGSSDQRLWLFKEVYAKIESSITHTPCPPEASFLHVVETRPNMHGDDTFAMPDHGLFVSGIIENLAPYTDLSLYRVLGKNGIGDTHILAFVLNEVIALAKAQDKNLVVNLSLGSDVPFNLEDGDDLTVSKSFFKVRRARRWFQNTSDAVVDHGHNLPEDARSRIVKVLKLSVENLSLLFAWPGNSHVLIVAAVGNDAFLTPPRSQPRYPAANPNVLGVAAVNGDEDEAEYSNPGDEPVNDHNGIATYGGNANLKKRNGIGPPRITDNDGRKDAIKGIFTSEMFPLPDTNNDTGWAYWIGTSFATPIITALAVNYWQEHSTATAGEVMKYIRETLANGTSGQLGVPLIGATPL